MTYRFAWGTDFSNLNHTTPSARLSGGTTPSSVAAGLQGLAPDTLYFFRLDVTVGGQTYSGALVGVTTTIPAPVITDTHTSWITNTAATLAGQVDASGFATTYHFEYGTTAAYGQSTPAVDAGATGAGSPVTFTVAGLVPGTTYHYRLVAQNTGGTTVGDDQVLTTSSVLLNPPRFSLYLRRRLGLASALHSGVTVRFRCSVACAAHFTVTLAPGFARGVALPLTLARHDASLSRAGSGVTTIEFPPSIRRRLRGRHQTRLAVSAYAVGEATRPTVPLLMPFTIVGGRRSPNSARAAGASPTRRGRPLQPKVETHQRPDWY